MINQTIEYYCEKSYAGWEVRRKGSVSKTAIWCFVMEEHAKLQMALLNKFMDNFKSGGIEPIPSNRLRLYSMIREIMTERGLPV